MIIVWLDGWAFILLRPRTFGEKSYTLKKVTQKPFLHKVFQVKLILSLFF